MISRIGPHGPSSSSATTAAMYWRMVRSIALAGPHPPAKGLPVVLSGHGHLCDRRAERDRGVGNSTGGVLPERICSACGYAMIDQKTI